MGQRAQEESACNPRLSEVPTEHAHGCLPTQLSVLLWLDVVCPPKVPALQAWSPVWWCLGGAAFKRLGYQKVVGCCAHPCMDECCLGVGQVCWGWVSPVRVGGGEVRPASSLSTSPPRSDAASSSPDASAVPVGPPATRILNQTSPFFITYPASDSLSQQHATDTA